MSLRSEYLTRLGVGVLEGDLEGGVVEEGALIAGFLGLGEAKTEGEFLITEFRVLFILSLLLSGLACLLLSRFSGVFKFSISPPKSHEGHNLWTN